MVWKMKLTTVKYIIQYRYFNIDTITYRLQHTMYKIQNIYILEPILLYLRRIVLYPLKGNLHLKAKHIKKPKGKKMNKETKQEIKRLNKELTELKEILERNKERLENYDETESYDEMLNECYPELFNIKPAYILSECDSIQYRCGLSDYEDEGRSELEGDIDSEEEQIEDLKFEIKELMEDE